MENATDALKMAAFVLIFVVALSISINAFGQAQQATTTILGYKDREYDYTYVDENKDSEGNLVKERIVNSETIIPSIYKAYKERYKIVFIDKYNQGIPLYTKDNVAVCSIDLGNDGVISLASNKQKDIFIKALLYGNNTTNLSNNEKQTIENLEKLGISLNFDGIYSTIINNNTFVEKLGVYYPSDIKKSSVPITNEEKKRVIIYIRQ